MKQNNRQTEMREIVTAFVLRDDGKPILTHVFDSIKEFKRKIELMPRYKEIAEKNDAFIAERKLIIDRLIEAYTVKHENKKESLNGKPLPEEIKLDLIDEIEKILSTKVDITTFKFTDDELEKSEISISEMTKIINFINT